MQNLWTELILLIAIWFALDVFDFSSIVFPWWMQITFFTYVAHDILLEGLEKILLKFLGPKPLFALLDYIFMPLVVLIILIIIATLMRKAAPKFWRVITGNR